MRMPPLLADFIYNRVCKLKCEKFLTRPRLQTILRKILDTTTLSMKYIQLCQIQLLQ